MAPFVFDPLLALGAVASLGLFLVIDRIDDVTDRVLDAVDPDREELYYP